VICCYPRDASARARAGISCRRGCVRLSVCLSVTSRRSTETAKHRITQTTPHDSPGTLASVAENLGETQTGSPPSPNGGAKCRWGMLNAAEVAENRRLSTRSVVNRSVANLSRLWWCSASRGFVSDSWSVQCVFILVGIRVLFAVNIIFYCSRLQLKFYFFSAAFNFRPMLQTFRLKLLLLLLYIRLLNHHHHHHHIFVYSVVVTRNSSHRDKNYTKPKNGP